MGIARIINRGREILWLTDLCIKGMRSSYLPSLRGSPFLTLSPHSLLLLEELEDRVTSRTLLSFRDNMAPGTELYEEREMRVM